MPIMSEGDGRRSEGAHETDQFPPGHRITVLAGLCFLAQEHRDQLHQAILDAWRGGVEPAAIAKVLGLSVLEVDAVLGIDSAPYAATSFAGVW
jgi:hypothetical protein